MENNIQEFPAEILYIICSHLDVRSICQLERTGKFFRDLLLSDHFSGIWKTFYREKFAADLPNGNIRRKYLKLCRLFSRKSIGHSIFEAARMNYRILLNKHLFTTSKVGRDKYIDYAVAGAAAGNRQDLITEILTRYKKDYREYGWELLSGACRWGQLAFVEKVFAENDILQFDAPILIEDLERCSVYAAEGNYSDLVFYLFSKGVTNFDKALFAAAQEGHLVLVNKIAQEIRNRQKYISSDRLLRISVEKRNIELAKLAISLGVVDFKEPIKMACSLDNPKFVLDLIIEIPGLDPNFYISELAKGRHFNLAVDLSRIAKKHDVLEACTANRILIGAAERGDLEVVKFAIECGSTDYQTSIISSAINKHYKITRYLLDCVEPQIK